MTKKTKTTASELQAARAARNEYQRAWRKAHPDKVKAYAQRHWLKVAGKAAADDA